jgi:hypothetical protein
VKADQPALAVDLDLDRLRVLIGCSDSLREGQLVALADPRSMRYVSRFRHVMASSCGCMTVGIEPPPRCIARST